MTWRLLPDDKCLSARQRRRYRLGLAAAGVAAGLVFAVGVLFGRLGWDT